MSAVERWDRSERLLLTAAIGEPDVATEAYARWRAQTTLVELEGAALKLLPLLGDRVPADDPLRRQLARVVRFSWLKSQLLVTRVLPGIHALKAAGVPVMLAKGAAVVHHTHGQLHLRPMDDLDLVVPHPLARRAAEVLAAQGMRAPSLPEDLDTTEIFDQVHAVEFVDPATRAELDLHWNVIHGSLHRGASRAFWERAVHGTLREVDVLVLGREDTLVQVIGHGQRLQLDRPLQWAADASLLLRGDARLDWDLVAATASAHRVAHTVGPALRALRALAPSLVPARLPPALERSRRGGPRRSTRAHWEEFVSRTVPPGASASPRDAVAFTKEAWGIERVRDAPNHLAWWASGRRGRLPAPPSPSVDLDPVEVGTPVRFSAGGAGVRLLGPGWWAPDAHGTWSRGRECALVVPTPEDPGRGYQVEFTIVPFLMGSRQRARVDAYVDGGRAARWHFSGGMAEQIRVIDVSPDAAGRLLAVRFVSADRISPTDAGAVADHRTISFALRAVQVTSSPGVTAG